MFQQPAAVLELQKPVAEHKLLATDPDRITDFGRPKVLSDGRIPSDSYWGMVLRHWVLSAGFDRRRHGLVVDWKHFARAAVSNWWWMTTEM